LSCIDIQENERNNEFMSNRAHIEKRLIQAAEQVLLRQHYVSAIDVLVGMNWLQPIQVQDWRKGKVPYLEKVIQCNLAKISFAMKCFRGWATQKQLKPSETVYLARTRGAKRALRFSISGDPKIETAYRTHYVSSVLSEKKQQRLKDKLERSPELIVYLTVSDSQCAQCKKELFRGSFLFMEAAQPLCVHCTKLDHLVFLPSGNAKLTRQAKKYSTSYAVVVKFSRARKRYERQGILVEEEALRKAESEMPPTPEP
jgi:hypothetical protein